MTKLKLRYKRYEYVNCLLRIHQKHAGRYVVGSDGEDVRIAMRALTWQELAAVLPDELQEFLERKYGIVARGRLA